MWNVRLRGPRGKQVVLQVDPDATFKSFSELAAKEVGLKTKDVPVFRKGFPPRALEVTESMLVKSVLEANDTVVVDAAASSSGAVQAKTTAKAKAKKAPAKKAAAAKAPKGGVHTLHPPSGTKKKAAVSKRKITGSGHQLGSSVEAEPSGAVEDDQEPKQKQHRVTTINLTSKEDVEISLVNAVSGQSKDRAAKFFRAATKTAVEHQYELTLANARLKAAMSNDFETEELSTTRRADGSSAQMRVRFKETPRKWKEETVDLLKENELQAILKYVLISGGETGREMLKPFNMAQLSTRVFWSIARLYDGDVVAGIADLVPDEDWSFLDIRTRAMSKKAMEAKANEEQYKMWKQGRSQRSLTSPSEQPNLVAESKTKSKSRVAANKTLKADLMSVNSSDAEEVDQDAAESKREQRTQTRALSAKAATPTTLRGAAAQAALSRLDRNARTSAVVSAFVQESKAHPPAGTVAGATVPFKTDNEETESDEGMEETTTVYCDSCTKARILSSEEAAEASLDNDPWTCAYLVKAGRTEGCDAIDDELMQITGAPIAGWLQKAGITTRKELADISAGSAMHALVNPLDPSAQTLKAMLEKLIDEARLDEVNDWMVEIVSDADLVGQLELQKLGTPADLLTTPTDLILQAVSSCADLSIVVVESWQKHAQRLVDKHPWLVEWRTL
ncbi:hypothetical protein PHYBOEH_006397 [Phytophthora boehmeriae]|uniref:ubiquitinyl hydrolase 1 n=1 Tax=Phytophthora boehmeriae TaxID=109152 RepID=A0A8T1XA16_9STRA|nr:hypothetical protein PHYBOEH_006397 [Phytophthora boehmeriae]